MFAYARDVLEGLFGGFLFCIAGFATGAGMVKAACNLRMQIENRDGGSVGMILVSAVAFVLSGAFIVFFGAATVLLFGFPIFNALSLGLEMESMHQWIQAVFYYVGGGFFIWSFLTKLPQIWERN